MLIIILSYDRIGRMGRRTVEICYHYQDSSSKDYEFNHELLLIAKYLEKNIPSFTAAGISQ